MASIESLGIGSGLLTSDLVDQIITAEREPTELRLDAQQARVEAEITAYGEVRTAVDKLQGSLSSLANASTIQQTKANSSDSDALTGTTFSNAQPGSYQIAVDQVASAHTLASQSYGAITDTLGTGVLTFKFGTTTYDGSDNYDSFTQDPDTSSVSITVSSENNTLSGIRDAINNKDFGVSASIVFDGSGYRLLLTSEDTGADNSLEITASGDAGLKVLSYNSTNNDENTYLIETQKGLDAQLRVNGLGITSESNNVTQVIQGVTLNVQQVTTGDVTFSVTRDASDVADKMETFITSYNEYKVLYDELTKYDPDTQEGGLLLGDSSLRLLSNQIRSTLFSVIDSFASENYRSLADLGIETDQSNDYQLSFERSTFTNALESEANIVAGILASSETTTDSQVSFLAKTIDTQPGSYDVVVERLATQATLEGKSTTALAFATDVLISGSNDEFSMTLNGRTEDVTLTAGTYSNGEDLAVMVQSAINDAFASNGSSISVVFNAADQRLEFTSTKFGSTSSVGFNSVDATVANILGIAGSNEGAFNGNSFSTLSDSAFGAATSPGTLAVPESFGINFSANPVTFDLTLTDGAPTVYSVSLDEDWSDILDIDGNVTTDRTREDVLTYINSELDEAGATGLINAEFNSAGRLVFFTNPAAGSQSLELSNLNVTNVDFLGLQEDTNNSGVDVSGAEFTIDISNRLSSATSGTIVVPDGTYETGADLATAIQTAINADGTIAAAAAGAKTTVSSRALTSAVDFATDPVQFSFNLNGTDYTVDVNANGTNNLDSIQTAIDGVLGAGVVTANLDGGGLQLETVSTGASEQLTILTDGIGATTSAGAVDLSAGTDFSLSPSTFTLVVDGTNIDVTVDGDGTAGTNDAASNLSVIQEALDTALGAAGTGSDFQAGDVVAKLDASNQLYFETVSKLGEKTESTFGADSSIEISAVDANATAVLGLSLDGPNINGADSVGFDLGLYEGFDAQATVTYAQDTDGNGSFEIDFGNDTTITISNATNGAIAQLGFSNLTGGDGDTSTGVDVKGTINGVEASGSGQNLTAQKGNEAATNGFLLGDVGDDFSTAVTIDSTNDTFRFTIDGVQSNDIVLTNGAYGSGTALAAELEKQINADSNFTSRQVEVDVQYDEATDIFGIISISRGSNSSVDLTAINGNAVDIFGLTSSSPGVKGKDASGDPDPAAGLILQIQGTTTGSRGSVNYVQGVFNKLEGLLDNMLGSNGILTEREAALDDDLDEVDEDRSQLEARLAAQEARLKAQFLFNDKIISQLKTTEDFLTQQFEALAASTKKD